MRQALQLVQSEAVAKAELPLDISPKLLAATPEQRARVRITSTGLHWDELDEGVGIKGLLREHGRLRQLDDAARGLWDA